MIFLFLIFYKYRYLEAISLNQNTTIKSAKFTKLSVITTRFYLSKLKKEGFLNAKINKDFYYQKSYYLIKKGKKLLDFFKSLEKEIKKLEENDRN